jgi:peptide/nickel transport system ATP-binding protein/oligopeptide transport system ATP-binding protein
MMVMYAGRIVETGTVTRVFAGPHHPYTRGLLGSVPRIGAERSMLLSIEGTPPSLTDLPDGCAFHPRCSFATDRCRAERPPLESFAVGREVACFHHRTVAAMTEAA